MLHMAYASDQSSDASNCYHTSRKIVNCIKLAVFTMARKTGPCLGMLAKARIWVKLKLSLNHDSTSQ